MITERRVRSLDVPVLIPCPAAIFAVAMLNAAKGRFDERQRQVVGLRDQDSAPALFASLLEMLQGQDLDTVAEGADQEQLTVLVQGRTERAHL